MKGPEIFQESPMPEMDRFLYRGTTPGWPGNPSLHGNLRTCAKTDPIVATLFAIECLQRGPAIVLVASWAAFDGLSGPTNHAAVFECEVVLKISPIEFAKQAIVTLDAQHSRDILVGMGFDRIPVRISGKSALGEAIVQSHKESDRLSPEQILLFNSHAMRSQS
jgi:hypothetical protein